MTASTTLIYDIKEQIRMIMLLIGITNGPIVDFFRIANIHRKLIFYSWLTRKNKSL